MMERTGMILVAILVGAAPAWAQQHQHGQSGAMDTPMAPTTPSGASMVPMMGMMGGTDAALMVETMRLQPSWVLRHRKELALTPAQVSSLESLADGPMMGTEMHGAMTAGQAGMHGAPSLGSHFETLMSREPVDTGAIRTAVMQMTAHRTEMMTARLVTAARVRGVLEPEQRDRLVAMPMPCMADGGTMGVTSGQAEPPQAPELHE